MSELPPPEDQHWSVNSYDPTMGESSADATIVGLMCGDCAPGHKAGIECDDRMIRLIRLTPAQYRATKAKYGDGIWDDCKEHQNAS